MNLDCNFSDESFTEFNKNNKIYVIDSHSHFGNDNFWPNKGDAKEYIRNNCNNVREVFAMSVPCPVILNEDGSKTILSYYRIEGGRINHYKVCEKDGEKKYSANLLGENPYKIANDYIYNMCKQYDKIKFNYVPIIHPYYYSYEDLINHVKRGAKIFKIHGVACGVIPQKINNEFFEILECLNIPILIHTDFSKEENILFYNSASNWLDCLKKYYIKTYFAHVARLSEKVIDIINDDTRYVVGLGPDKLLSLNDYNEHNTKNFLEYCFNRFKIDKLIFDLDYPWNIKCGNDYDFDWDSIKRINKSGLSFEEKNKILSKNINRFLKNK